MLFLTAVWNKKTRFSALAAACLSLVGSGALAGTWTFRPWVNDGDIPQPAPGLVTHAVAFGIELEPPVPAPFEITKNISGENWAVWRMPEHTASAAVGRRSQAVLDSISVGGEGASLLRGQICPTGPRAGLAIELSGLEPGKNYTLALFGLGFSVWSQGAKFQVEASASDAAGQREVLGLQSQSARILVYEYTAPSDGQITVSFETSESDPNSKTLRLCAFLNHRVE